MATTVTPKTVFASSGRRGSNAIGERLHITAAAISEGLRLQTKRGKFGNFSLREDDNLA